MIEEYITKGVKITINNLDDWELVAEYDQSTIKYCLEDARYYLIELEMTVENLEQYSEITFVPNPIIFQSCDVADQYCHQTVIGECFCCSGVICENCYLTIEWYSWGEQKICHNCVASEDGNDDRVIKHLEKLAGY